MVGARRRVPLPPARQPPATTHPRTCQADEGETKKRRKAEDDGGIGEKAIKWAEEFDSLGEDDQYTYLEELAPRMRCLAHLCTHAGDGLASYPFRPCPLCGLQAGTPAWRRPESEPESGPESEPEPDPGPGSDPPRRHPTTQLAPSP